MDVYTNKIQQLAGMAGFTKRSLNMVMKLAFVTGFPNDISTELQQALAIEMLTMDDLLTRDMAEDTVAATQIH